MQTTGASLLVAERRCILCLRALAQDSRGAYRLLYLAAVRTAGRSGASVAVSHFVRRRTCQTDRSQVGGGPQPLAHRRLSPRDPPTPVAYALAQLGHLNSELNAGHLCVRAAITVLLRVSGYEHRGLLICAVSSDGAVAGVGLMISPSYSHRLLISRDLLIRRDLHSRPLPVHSCTDLAKCCSLMRSKWRRWASLCGQNVASVAKWPSRLDRRPTVKTQLTAVRSRPRRRSVTHTVPSDRPPSRLRP